MPVLPRSRLSLTALVALALSAASCADTADPGPAALTDAQRAAVLSVDSSFVRAWLRDDTTAVLAAFSPDAVLLPPGGSPVRGREAIRDYWWPHDGSHTRIVTFTRDVLEVDGSADLAYVRADATLGWDTVKDGKEATQSSRSQDLILYRRGADGRWRVIRQMWSTRP